MAIYRGPGGPGDAVNDASSEVLLALAAKDAAIAAQVAAQAAQAAAETAQAAAELAETNAETAETNAETAETNAETAETNAETAQAAAEAAQAAAEAAQLAAETAETNAETAETNAETAATNAANSASAASTSASNAATSATNASNSASAAATSATNAANSATAAQTAQTAAELAETNAETAETNAEAAQAAAEAAQLAAETAETNAETAETNAETAATNAANSASAAATSATNASNSASAAATSATNASNSASAAATSATAAQTAQTAAETARDQTLTAYDNFDDRYLGAKSSAPSVDNDGNTLLVGALYFNTATNEMKVWDGSAWLNAYASLSGALLATNNLSDLNNTATARTNLGVTIGVNVQAYDAQLADIAGLTPSDNNFIVGNGTNFVTESGSTARTSLGLGSIATQESSSVSITGGSISGITDLAVADGGTGSSTASGARTNLGLAIGTDVQAYNANLQGASQGGINGMKNRIINGAMVIDQRNAGASVSLTDGLYFVDRWKSSISQTSRVSGQRSTVAPTNFINSILTTVTSAFTPSAGDYCGIVQPIEGFNTADLNWGTANAQTVTVSFWVRSSVTGTYSVALHNDATNRSYVTTYTINSANTWEQKSVTIAGDTAGTWLTNNGVGITAYFALGMGSTFGGATANTWNASLKLAATGQTQWVSNAGATFYITGVQLEVGSTATSFDYRPYGTELALCQRYFQRVGDGGNPFAVLGVGRFASTTAVSMRFPWSVNMRATPSASFNTATYQFTDGTSSRSVGAISIYSAGTDGCEGDVVTSSATNGAMTQLRGNAAAPNAPYINLSAEL